VQRASDEDQLNGRIHGERQETCIPLQNPYKREGTKIKGEYTDNGEGMGRALVGTSTAALVERGEGIRQGDAYGQSRRGYVSDAPYICEIIYPRPPLKGSHDKPQSTALRIPQDKRRDEKRSGGEEKGMWTRRCG